MIRRRWPLYRATMLFGILTACTTPPNNAPVIERSAEILEAPAKVVTETPVIKTTTEPRASYVVKRGDTLSRIAFDHELNYADLVGWNSLKNPDDIKVNQVLWIAPPEGSSATKTNGISNGSVTEVRNLTPIIASTNKSNPKGDKRPYSEANLAELQKIEASPAGSGIAKNESPTVKVVEKVAQVVAPEPMDWIWPTNGKMIAGFDNQKNKGIDLTGKAGQDVVAVAAGKVSYEGVAIRGYGNLVIITHANNFLSAYANNKTNLVKQGQMVSKGQKIAEMGSSDSDIVKLHFEIRQEGKPVDPLKFLPGR